MIVLKSSEGGLTKPRWEPVELAPGVTVDLQITPPSYELFVREQLAGPRDERGMLRLECVTDWKGVVSQQDGSPGTFEVPFSRDAFTVMLRQFPGSVFAVLKALRPLFEGPEDSPGEDPTKNS